jgi:hypothetical protein
LPGLAFGSRGSGFCHCSSFKNQVGCAIGPAPIAYYLKLLRMAGDLTYCLYNILCLDTAHVTTLEVMKQVLKISTRLSC